jgi:hypothetical protein
MVQCVTAMASDLLLAVSAQRRYLPVPARTVPVADLHVATVDPMGRVWVRLSARLLGWMPGQTVMLTIRDGVLHMSGDTSAAAGVPAALDHRRRVQVPFGLRATVGFDPGTRVLVVTVPSAGSVAVLPVDRVVTAFGIDR